MSEAGERGTGSEPDGAADLGNRKQSQAQEWLMRPWVRWSLAIVISAAAFAVAWWVCQVGVGLDEGAALGIASVVFSLVLTLASFIVTRKRPSDEAKKSLQTGFKQLSVFTKWLSGIEHVHLSQKDREIGAKYGTKAFQGLDGAMQKVQDPEVSSALERVKGESWMVTLDIMQGRPLPDLGSLQSMRNELKRLVKTRMRINV
jgi:hypothetical protein